MWSFFSRDASKDFAYEIGSEITGLKDYSIWKLHSGKKKATGEPVSIFVFEADAAESQVLLDMGKAALKRLKTLRHPSVLTYIDSLETDKLIYLVVEPVEPLYLHISTNSYTPEQKLMANSWGLYQIACGLTFLSKDCQLSHNNICMSSIFVDKAGEWKLFGLEYIAPLKDAYPVKVIPELNVYNPPETSNPKDAQPGAYDSWGLGCLIWEAFNGKLTKPSMLKNTNKIPSSLCPLYCELVSANPNSRPNSSTFLKKASKSGGFFKNKFVDSMLFLREIHIKDNDEKIAFFNNLPASLEKFPQDVCLHKVLPELVVAFEFGNAGSSVLTPMFKLGNLLSEEEYQKKIVPCIVKMFSSKDRATRAKLLQQVEQFIDHIQPSVINSQIFPNVAQGFMDTNPTIRDETIKCMMYLAPKLNYQNLNVEMLKHFARLQSKDDQGGIRTNTTVCLGKISSYLHPETRKKVLISAFLRALRDPFPPARTAAILALSATEHYYSINDCATKVLPALCHFTVDPEKSIRDQAFKSIGGFISKLEKVSEDPSLIEKLEEELQSTTPASIAASWTSWAVTSIADKLYKSKKQTNPTSPANPSQSTETNVENLRTSEQSESPSNDTYSWNDDWGETNDEVSQGVAERPKDLSVAKKSSSEDHSGWEDEWESLEDDNTDKSAEKLRSFFPEDRKEDPFCEASGRVDTTPALTPTPVAQSGWESGDWDSWETNSNATKPQNNKEELERKREASRLAREERQRQLQQRRQAAKPKKLGAQKIS